MKKVVKPLYVSSNPRRGGLVSRFGLPHVYIGATRGADNRIRYNGEVVVIPAEEYRAHKREYDKAIKDGSLIKRDEAAHKAHLVELEKKAVEIAELDKKKDAAELTEKKENTSPSTPASLGSKSAKEK